jgi:hypothetical protein
MHDRNELITSLKSGVVKLLFEKSDGTQRVMQATLESSWLPLPTQPDTGVQRKSSDPNLIKVWDTQAHAWRSMRLERLISWHSQVMVTSDGQ